jgi:hypothetical protein
MMFEYHRFNVILQAFKEVLLTETGAVRPDLDPWLSRFRHEIIINPIYS